MLRKKSAVTFVWTILPSSPKSLAVLTLGCLLIFLPFYSEKRIRRELCSPPISAITLEELLLDQAAVDASLEAFLVPNYVHFFRLGASARRLNLIEVLCLLAVFRNQRPEKIFVHTDDVEAATKSFSDYNFGKKLLMEPGFAQVLHFLPYPQPKHVFGVPFSAKYREWHMSDLARLRILRKYGGLFLDNDVYLFRNADALRHHELSVLASAEGLENCVVSAHRCSRLLSAWITSYTRYDPHSSFHHRTPYFLRLLRNFDPQPFVVKDGVVKSNVHKFLTDDIPQMLRAGPTIAVTLNTMPRDEVPQLEYLKYIWLYGRGFIDRYFKMDDVTRKRVNFVNRYLFDNLSP